MKNLTLTLATFFFSILSFAQLNTNLLYHWKDTTLISSFYYDNTYNEIWGVEINGAEIAIIGTTAGTHFFDVTNPATATEVAFVTGAYTGSGVVHRDYHDYQGYLYAVCDEGSASTLQIIDISNLPNTVSVVYDSNSLFSTTHNIFIDTATAKLYTSSHVYSLANPTNPSLIVSYANVIGLPGSCHDIYVRNDTAYMNCGSMGLYIVDFSMTGTPIPVQPNILANITAYPDAGYNHSGWLNEEGNIYALLDENHSYDIKLLDVSDLSNISVVSTLNSGVDSNSMAHNAIIKDNLLFVSYYHDGLRVFDITDPYNPMQVCNYDTYPHSMTYCAIHNNHLSYKGAWGVYPYFSSNKVLLSDMQTGLYVFNYTIPVNSIENINLNLSIYPNPAKTQFTIKNNTADYFTLYNSLGVKVMSQKVSQDQTTIKRGNLANGLYFYHLNSGNTLIESGKVIFE